MIEILVLQAIAYHAQGDLPAALLPLQHALALAEPEGYVRMFLDEGSSMMQLLREASAREIMPDYTDKLLAAFEAEKRKSEDKPDHPSLPEGPGVAPDRAIEPTRVRNTPTHCPGTLESRDRRAAFPRPGHGQRA